LTQGQAVSLSLAIISLSWVIYDSIWNVKIIRVKSVSLILSVFFFVGLIFLNFQIFSGRGAFMQTGVIFGSLMLLNVWVRILPGQRKMIKEAQSGQVPDYSVSLKSKVRSVHNTYFIFPVLFIMLSNHFPTIYNNSQKVFLLVCLAISGALVRHAMVTKIPKERWTLLPASVGLAFLVYITGQATTLQPVTSFVGYQQVKTIFASRCLACHSSKPTDDVFKVAPNGIIFESESQIRAVSEKIYQQVVVGKVMPLGNKTQMTDEERAIIQQWLKQ
jgi:uncharacterized membrane protein